MSSGPVGSSAQGWAKGWAPLPTLLPIRPLVSFGHAVSLASSRSRPLGIPRWSPLNLVLKDKRVVNKKLLGAKGIATRSKDATRARGSWPYY